MALLPILGSVDHVALGGFKGVGVVDHDDRAVDVEGHEGRQVDVQPRELVSHVVPDKTEQEPDGKNEAGDGKVQEQPGRHDVGLPQDDGHEGRALLKMRIHKLELIEILGGNIPL